MTTTILSWCDNGLIFMKGDVHPQGKRLWFQTQPVQKSVDIVLAVWAQSKDLILDVCTSDAEALKALLDSLTETTIERHMHYGEWMAVGESSPLFEKLGTLTVRIEFFVGESLPEAWPRYHYSEIVFR